jgi:acyl-CoA thioester hydrolase
MNPLTHTTTYRVIYGDTDNMGHAYYANYFRWFEIGRTEMFRAMGLAYRDMESKGLFLPVSEAFSKYKAPVRYDDILTIETSLDAGLKGGLKFDYQIFCNNAAKPAAIGFTKHACINQHGKVVRPPEFLLELIQAHTDADLSG